MVDQPTSSPSRVDEVRNIRRAMIQCLESDRMLGVHAAPIAPAPAPQGGRPPVDVGRSATLDTLDKDEVRGCRKCGLCDTRKQTVFGCGSSSARLVFVGEAPGFEEDRQGVPFVGRAGQLLDRMILAMTLRREDVYICNVLKCRPPNNRDPAADEIAACSPYLMRQLATIQPEVIVALGAPAARLLLGTGDSIGRLRGRFHSFGPPGTPMADAPVPLMPTYHPAYLLRSPNEKTKTWSDLQMVMKHLGLARVEA